MSQLSLFPAPEPPTRSEAIKQLLPYLNQDLRPIADRFGITHAGKAVHHSGWAGHTVEWLLGSPPNNVQAPDFGTWELKVTSLKSNKNQCDSNFWEVKGSIALTQVQAQDLVQTSFEESHLFSKIKYLLIAGRLSVDQDDFFSPLVTLCEYDLAGSDLIKVKQEYENIQWAFREFGLMGIDETQTEWLGLQRNQSTRGGARFIARKAWVKAMFNNGLRHERKEEV